MSHWFASMFVGGGRALKGTAVKLTQESRFGFDPTPAQELALRSHAGAARFAWNWALGKCRERYAAERKWYSGAELHKLWNQAKRPTPPWPGGSRTPSAPTRSPSGTLTARCATSPSRRRDSGKANGSA